MVGWLRVYLGRWGLNVWVDGGCGDSLLVLVVLVLNGRDDPGSVVERLSRWLRKRADSGDGNGEMDGWRSLSLMALWAGNSEGMTMGMLEMRTQL